MGLGASLRILVTGSAGFIGSHVAQVLLDQGHEVLGLDNLNDYYEVALKQARLDRLLPQPGYRHAAADIADRAEMERLFAGFKPERVVHLAAQAGVRYAAQNPHVYASSNLVGFLHVLEGCRHHGVQHLVFASTSSVYGGNTRLPFSEHQPTEHPLTFYAATKKANEAMAHSYAHLYGLPCTGLRFFTVYGPWGRPDMAFFSFTRAIIEGRPIAVFNHGQHSRDFTYIDDIVSGVVGALARPAQPNPEWNGVNPDPATSSAPYRIYNIGNARPVQLLRYIELLEQAIGRKAVMEMKPLQPGDVPDTASDVSALASDTGYAALTPVEVGVPRFVSWYRDYYRV
jgi:UDP-glucuronate 4-epimerase